MRTRSDSGAIFVALGHTALLAAVVGVGACASAKVPAAVQTEGSSGGGIVRQGYEATIRRTSFGIPHIVAADLGSLGFGEGYAQAEDHLCTIADQVVRGRGERAKYFGRGDGDRHLLSDVAAKAMRARAEADSGRAAPPRDLTDWLEGFAVGYNLYLERTGRDALPGWCRGQEWVFAVTPVDLLAAGRPAVFGAQMARARPPGAGGAGEAGGPLGELSLGDEPVNAPQGASQGWALGRDLSESGRGALLANPHFAWGGSSRFWEKHLTIPGALDVYGVNLIGVPGVAIGFNDRVAWTVTTSTAAQFTIYRLRLVPGRPTRYHYGDEERDMTPVEVSVAVRGETEPVRRTVWFTHYGPVFVTAAFAWTPEFAYAVRHAASRSRGASQFGAMSRARSLADFKTAVADGMGFGANTVAVSADGLAWFSVPSGTPNLSREAIGAWSERRKTDLAMRAAWETNRIVLLDGSDPAFEWPDVSQSGRSPLAVSHDVPQLERSDYVFNGNNSFWLAHPEALLTGEYSPLHGDQRTELTLRARSNVLHLTNASPYRAAGADGKFSLREIQDAVLDNRSLTADLLLAELVERCTATPTAVVDGRTVDLSRACAVLGRWDRRFDLDSRGAVLFREWIGRYDDREFARSVNAGSPRRNGLGDLFAVAFDPADPITTPRGLAPGSLALQNLAKAAGVLEGRGLALDVALGEVQYAPTKLPKRIAVHGGHGDREGVLNFAEAVLGNFTTLEPLQLAPRVTGSRFLTEAGYPVLHGSSFVMALEYTAGGPRAMALLTYSQSGDPASPHFTDQTERFARKEWRPILFRPADVARDVKREYTLSAPRLDGAGRPGSRALGR